nr:unnamed protein product [Callosobruchus analis]
MKKKRTIWVRNWMQRKRATFTILKELYNEDLREYKSVMRMTPAQVEILLNLIAPKIQRQDTYMRDAISARVKLEITVLYISSGISYRLMFIFFRVSKASITKLIPEMCDAINRSLKDFIKIPSMEERQAIQVGLDSRLDFPGCCGDVDGKHITHPRTSKLWHE